MHDPLLSSAIFNHQQNGYRRQARQEAAVYGDCIVASCQQTLFARLARRFIVSWPAILDFQGRKAAEAKLVADLIPEGIA